VPSGLGGTLLPDDCPPQFPAFVQWQFQSANHLIGHPECPVLMHNLFVAQKLMMAFFFDWN
jgi:hypothetical protein